MGFFTRDGFDDNGTPVPKQYSTVRALAASGRKIAAHDTTEISYVAERRASQRWQQESWEYFDAIGEIQYAFTLFSNVMSRIRLYAAYVEDDQDNPTPIKKSEASEVAKEAADKAMRRVFGGIKQANLLRRSSLNLLVAGECYLVQDQTTSSGIPREEWKIVSVDELVSQDGWFALKSRRDGKKGSERPLARNAFIGRMWKEHPRYSDEPISSMKALCDICDELLLLSRTVRATARSRLNAGALYVPDEISVGYDTPTDVDDSDDPDLEQYMEDESADFEENLVDALSTPISDEDSASAVVPLIIRGPADMADKLRLIKFERSFDQALANRADRALERILQGIDMPKEMVAGLSSVKYANAIVINEAFYTTHIEPMVIVLCDLFRTIYLEDALRKSGVPQDEIDKIVIWYDPSGITTAPDRSSAANVGFDKDVLSAEAWRRYNGFTEDDAASAGEVLRKMVLRRGVVTPELTDTIFGEMSPDLIQSVRQFSQDNSVAPIPESVNDLLNSGAQAPPADPTDQPVEAPVNEENSSEDDGPEGPPTPPELIV